MESPMDRGAWWAAVHGVAGSRVWLSDFTFTFHFHALEKEMAIHSSVLAWRSPGTEEPGGLPSVGSHRVGHDWSDLAAAAAGISKVTSKNLSQELSLGIAWYTPGHLTQLNDYSQMLISRLYIMEHLTFIQRLVTEVTFRNNLRVSF